jgi:site-specific recombinase XerD
MKKNMFIHQLGEYFEVFLPDIHNARKNTISAYADSFAILFQFLQEKKGSPHYLVTYKCFTAALFDEYIIWLRNERQYSDASVHQRMSAITTFLKYASRREMSALRAYSAAASMEVPSGKNESFSCFMKEEIKILLGLPNPNKYLGSRDLVLLSFLYDTGARAQELCDVCVGDVRFGAVTKVRLNGKGNKIREIPVSDEVSGLLRYYLKKLDVNLNEQKDRQLFSSQTNEKMTTACVRSIVKKYVSIAKNQNPALFSAKNYSPHSFRHSKAVHMVESGVSLINIRNFLGHATFAATEIYARVGQAAVTKAFTNLKIPRLAAEIPDSYKKQTSLPSFITAVR